MLTPETSNPTSLAALYQVSARWYANDAQLIWRRVALVVTLNSALVTAQIFASHLHLAIRVALPFLGVLFCLYWDYLLGRAWLYQDFQAAVLRDQERAMGLERLGVFSRAFAIRQGTDRVEIAGASFSRKELTSSYRHRNFTKWLIWVFVAFHLGLLIASLAGVSLVSHPGSSTP